MFFHLVLSVLISTIVFAVNFVAVILILDTEKPNSVFEYIVFQVLIWALVIFLVMTFI